MTKLCSPRVYRISANDNQSVGESGQRKRQVFQHDNKANNAQRERQYMQNATGVETGVAEMLPICYLHDWPSIRADCIYSCPPQVVDPPRLPPP